MDEEFTRDIITITDEDGEEFTLEVLDEMDYNNRHYGAYVPADMDEDDPDYGMIILRIINDENGEILLEDIEDNAELQDVYEHFMILLFDDEDEVEDEEE